MATAHSTLMGNAQHDEAQIGAKFHRLGLFSRQGLVTPKFFCLPRSMFDQVANELAGQIHPLLEKLDRTDPTSFKSVADEIRSIFLKYEIAGDTQQKIHDTFDIHFDSNDSVAVRATIIGNEKREGEDGESEPFAGMSESYLEVDRSSVLSKVKLCWASGFSEQAMLYRNQQNYHPSGFGVAVAIQKMVESSESFVSFSCDPQTQARETVIAVGRGLGELVVQEKTDIEHIRVDHRSGRISRRSSGEADPILNDLQIKLVDDASRKLESLFSHPQDVEGSFDKNGKLYILQSRPVAIVQNQYRLWSSANISESFPGVTTPLTFSVARRFYADLNRDYYRRCGTSKAELRQVNGAFDRLLGYLDGRIYHCITNFQRTTAVHPLARFFESDYDRFVCELDRDYCRPKPPKKRSWIGGWARVAWAAMVAFGHYYTLPWKFWRFTVWWRKLKERLHDESLQSNVNSTSENLNELWEEASRQWGITLVNYQQMVFFHSVAEKLLARWSKTPNATLSELLGDGSRLFGSEVVARALEISDAIRDDSRLAEKFTNTPAERLWQEIDSGNFDSNITLLIKQHLERFGVRGLEELKMEVPNLRDQPEEFIRVLQNYVQGNQRYSDLLAREKKESRRGIWNFARSVYFNPFKVWTMLVVSKSLRKALERREIGRYMRGELFCMTKERLFSLAEELVKQGCIECRNDILFLAMEEISDALEGRSYTQDLKSIVKTRRDEAATFQIRNPRKELVTYGIVNQGLSQDTSDKQVDDQITGIGSCAGIVRGRARVIHKPTLSQKMEPDDILVAPETDPGWLYLMLGAKGIVVERGSLLSHTAITGRKFSIPTVVAAENACKLISEGDEIQIDGQTGTVEILKKAGS